MPCTEPGVFVSRSRRRLPDARIFSLLITVLFKTAEDPTVNSFARAFDARRLGSIAFDS